jgi:DNA-binding NarL/FixJ family response regulator
MIVKAATLPGCEKSAVQLACDRAGSVTKRVLVVDDHVPWRHGIRSMLRSSPQWQIVGEAGDGVSAPPLVAALAPDVVLLDVELPGMSGIDAAPHIRVAAPAAKILFVSAHRSWDIAEAAFAAGARGYVLKSHAGAELLPAMNAITADRRFISGVFVGRAIDSGARAAGAAPARTHEAGFFSNDASALDRLVRFSENALTSGQSLIVVTRTGRLDDLRRRLGARLDIELAVRQGRYVPCDEDEMRANILVDGWPDDARFWRNATSLVLSAARFSMAPHARVAACGEWCGHLLHDGHVDAAMRLEHLWDELGSAFNVDMFCTYTMAVPDRDAPREVFERICGEHSAVYSQ